MVPFLLLIWKRQQIEAIDMTANAQNGQLRSTQSVEFRWVEMTADMWRELGRRSCTVWQSVRGTFAGHVAFSAHLPRRTSTHIHRLHHRHHQSIWSTWCKCTELQEHVIKSNCHALWVSPSLWKQICLQRRIEWCDRHCCEKSGKAFPCEGARD